MEENTKQQQLTFDKGITNVPSDALCSDNALAECVGLVYENSESRVIQKPRKIMLGAPKILFVHKYNDQERYVAIQNGVIKWGVNDGGTYAEDADHSYILSSEGEVQITSIGKTLIITDDNGLHYATWNNEGYKQFDKIPSPSVSLRLSDGGWWTNAHGNCEGMVAYNDAENRMIITDGKERDYDNRIKGLYAECKNSISRQKAFSGPFFVRYALKMYDDSYLYVSNPILMFPSTSVNTCCMFSFRSQTAIVEAYEAILSLWGCKLQYKQDTDYAGYSDLVKGVTLFVSDQIELAEINERVTDPDVSSQTKVKGIYATSLLDYPHWEEKIASEGGTGIPSNRSVDVLKPRHRADVRLDIEKVSIFYKLCDLTQKTSEWTSVDEFIGTYVLENITTQDRLDEDDYFSRSDIIPKTVYEYNGRLNIANVSRSFFEGYANFLPNDGSNYGNYDFYVRIETDNGYEIIHRDNYSKEKQGWYFYYPDARAKHVWIFKEQYCILDEDLTEHPGLNGAYYFGGVPTSDNSEVVITGVEPPAETEHKPELLSNYVIQSGVNNPFYFPALGYHKVGTGKVIALSTTTMALSQDKFGQTDLIVFTEDGIYGMEVDKTGSYVSIHVTSRDVCKRRETVIQTDGAVFFVSKKGLMVVTSNGVKCVSEQLSGQDVYSTGGMMATSQPFKTGLPSGMPFQRFLDDCFIAYDYRDSLLWIFNDQEDYCYVYGLKTGTFSKFEGLTVSSVCNNYPDYLIQDGNDVYSLTGRVDINEDPEDYSATIVTRPMKLENAFALKSLMDVRHVSMLQGEISLKVYGSNTMRSWVRLTSLRGVPWKYFLFRIDFTNLRATDRYAGCMLITQERRTNRLR